MINTDTELLNFSFSFNKAVVCNENAKIPARLNNTENNKNKLLFL